MHEKSRSHLADDTAFQNFIHGGVPHAGEYFVTYTGIGVARVQRKRTGPTTSTFDVRLNGAALASGLASLTLGALDTLLNYTGEPPTVAETLADHEARLDVLEA